MSRRGALLACAGAALLAGCAEEPVLDHSWAHERCAVEIAGGAWAPPTDPGRSARAAAYLRRANGASSLVVQVDAYGIGIGDPYPSAPTLRFSVPPGTRAPATLTVVPDASDVRGPAEVSPGTAWVIQTPASDVTKPQDGWRFGSGTMQVVGLELAERDTGDRDFVTLDARFDLSDVRVAPLAQDPASPAEPEPIGGAMHIVCVDEGTPSLAGAGGAGGGSPDGGADADTGDATDAGDAGDGGPAACGTAGSCANPACGDCNGDDADFCETDLRDPAHCGSCARSCGTGGTCDPLGACRGASVGAEPALGVAIGAGGVGWLAGAGPQAGSVRFAAAGGAPTTVASGGTISALDRIVLDGADLVWASYAGISRATVPGGAPTAVAGAIQPDSLRLLGATATHVYWLTLNEQNARDVVRRVDRATFANIEVVACLPIGTYDATVQGSTGVVLVSDGIHVLRFDTPVGGSSCTSTTAGTTLATAGAGESFWRVVAGASRAVVMVQAGSAAEVRALTIAGGAQSPAPLGAAATFPSAGQTAYPLAIDGDVAFWVDAAAPANGRWRIVSAAPGSSPAPFALAEDTLADLAASPSGVAWSTPSGVYRVAR